MNTPLLTTEQAAEYLQVEIPWLYRHPEVPRVKVGNLLRFRVSDLDRYIDAHTVRTGSGRTARSGNRRNRY